MDERPIGVFDSGVGGLTVVDEIRRIMPQENIVYFGDTARVPYGAKNRETIQVCGVENVRFLLQRDVKIIIIACGTVSSNAYDYLTNMFEIPLIDVIRPGVQACVDANSKQVGFIATEATVRSGLFAQLLHAQRPEIPVHVQACPLFAPLVEEGWIDNDVTKLVASLYLDGWRETSLDTLVLGCTHYPLLTGVLEQILGPVHFINMAEYTVRTAQSTLMKRGMLNENKKPPAYRFFASGYTDKFDRMVQLMLHADYHAEKVETV